MNELRKHIGKMIQIESDFNDYYIGELKEIQVENEGDEGNLINLVLGRAIVKNDYDDVVFYHKYTCTLYDWEIEDYITFLED